MIVRDFLICLLQMYLLEDLEKNMLPYRRENFLGKFLVYFVIALVMLGINHKINLLTFLLFLTYDSIFSDTIMYNSDEILLLTPLINIAFLPIYVTIHLFAELPNLQHCYCFAQKK